MKFFKSYHTTYTLIFHSLYQTQQFGRGVVYFFIKQRNILYITRMELIIMSYFIQKLYFKKLQKSIYFVKRWTDFQCYIKNKKNRIVFILYCFKIALRIMKIVRIKIEELDLSIKFLPLPLSLPLVSRFLNRLT